MEKKPRIYEITVKIILEPETVASGLERAKEMVEYCGLKIVNAKHVSDTATRRQKNAMHLWFEQVSTEANEKGLTLNLLFKNPQEMHVTPELLKEYFKQYAYFLFKKDSTEKLTKEEMDKLIKIFEQKWAEVFGIDAPFPSINTMFDEKY